jgi:hypothetical protein
LETPGKRLKQNRVRSDVVILVSGEPITGITEALPQQFPQAALPAAASVAAAAAAEVPAGCAGVSSPAGRRRSSRRAVPPADAGVEACRRTPAEVPP